MEILRGGNPEKSICIYYLETASRHIRQAHIAPEGTPGAGKYGDKPDSGKIARDARVCDINWC